MPFHDIVSAKPEAWELVGNPIGGNIARSPASSTNTFGAGHRANTYGLNHDNNTYGAGHRYNVYGHQHAAITYGDTHVNNRYENGHFACLYGSFHGNNWYGGAHQNNVYGSNHFGNTYGGSCLGLLIGDNFQGSNIGYGCESIQVDDRCRYIIMRSSSNVHICSDCNDVEIINCNGTPGAPFVIPSGTTNAVFRNNLRVL